jgi:alkylation response protein AidB-like acyl-CoA dehydrogenase
MSTISPTRPDKAQTVAPVRLGVESVPIGARLRLASSLAPTDVDSALNVAQQLGAVSSTGDGATMDLWEALATLASVDLGAARAVEPHLDALAILEQAGSLRSVANQSTWGVFAAEGGGDPLHAFEVDGQWRLTGTKPWCSLADRVDRALVTAHLPTGGRGLFDVDLTTLGIRVAPRSWPSRGLTEIASGPVAFHDVLAIPVGGPDWYLTRPGFAWGGIGVAACWFGGAVAIARTVFVAAGATPASIMAMHLGQLDGMVQSARRALAESAHLIDSGTVGDGPILAKRARAAVASACEEIVRLAGHAMGPAPLAMDATHAKRVADLQLYIRQHHAEKDDASLGNALAAAGTPPW